MWIDICLKALSGKSFVGAGRIETSIDSNNPFAVHMNIEASLTIGPFGVTRKQANQIH
jgi:hypothetical protein